MVGEIAEVELVGFIPIPIVDVEYVASHVNPCQRCIWVDQSSRPPVEEPQ